MRSSRGSKMNMEGVGWGCGGGSAGSGRAGGSVAAAHMRSSGRSRWRSPRGKRRRRGGSCAPPCPKQARRSPGSPVTGGVEAGDGAEAEGGAEAEIDASGVRRFGERAIGGSTLAALTSPSEGSSRNGVEALGCLRTPSTTRTAAPAPAAPTSPVAPAPAPAGTAAATATAAATGWVACAAGVANSVRWRGKATRRPSLLRPSLAE